jgi:high-affinity iron transporter
MLSSLFIILREVLEASIIISVLIAAMNKTSLKNSWIFLAFFLGVMGSFIMASTYNYISDSFEGVGQEILNASLLISIAILLSIFVFIFIRYRFISPAIDLALTTLLVAIVSLAISREGVEIYIYVTGYVNSFSESLPLIIGATIGAGIGISSGALIYYSLINCSLHLKQLVSCSLIALISAGMLSESILYLMQADWINSTQPVWNSSSIVTESSATGQLLYALFAYEATPTVLQVIAYFITLAIFFILTNRARYINRQSLEKSAQSHSSKAASL